jgi:CDP-6-deoxy-D-xylo-4-hexulose-3-dehydrase
MLIKKNNTRISYGQNVYDKNEINAVLKTLKKSTQMGKYVNNFEIKISKLFSKKNALMVNSGSSAILLALKVSTLKKEVKLLFLV